MTHLMLDIETLGTRPGAVVLSVAFVRFSDEASFTVNLSVKDQISLGLEIDLNTHAWWGQQDPAAWAAATSDPQPLRTCLDYFQTWINWAVGPDALIWCHGATFDAPILGELYRRSGLEPPWKFWNIRDTRTLNDAVAQTRAVNAALAILSRAHVGVAA